MNIFVGCSSRNIGNMEYENIADKLGDYIGSKGYNLVFGGCEEGLMGQVYRKVIEKNPYGVIVTQAKVYEEQAKNIKNAKVYIYPSINERKNGIIEHSDVCVFIPGGIGTIDEFFACLESKRAGEHSSPIILINQYGFFNNLIDMLEVFYKEKLASIENKELYTVVDTVEDAICLIENLHI